MRIMLAIAAAATLAAAPALAEEVTVSIDGVEATGSTVLVALQTEEQFLQKDGEYTQTATADMDMLSVTFDDVEPGTYAVAVVVDADGDGDFMVGDTGPMEPWGLSGGMQDGAPEFEPASIEVMEGEPTEASVTVATME